MHIIQVILARNQTSSPVTYEWSAFLQILKIFLHEKLGNISLATLSRVIKVISISFVLNDNVGETL